MKKFMKKIMLLVLCTALIIPQTGCGSEEQVSENQFLLDTICTITVGGMKEKDAKAVIAEAFETCRYYESKMSKTVEGSDIYRLNHAQGRAVTVDPETLEVIKKGIQYGKLSGGRFDITIGAVSELWDFSGENPRVPDEKQLKEAVKTVDYRQIHIEGNKVAMKNPKAQIDLGGIAKGYIADKLAARMKEQGAEQAIISLGGNVAVIGEKAEDTPWNIGIERPYSDRTQILGTVKLKDETITTSGVYERCFKEDGKLYHHVLDPKTGYPVETQLDAVTVKGREGQSADCDAMGTICLILGEEKGRQALKEFPGLEAAFIDRSDHISATEGMTIDPVE